MHYETGVILCLAVIFLIFLIMLVCAACLVLVVHSCEVPTGPADRE